MADLPEEFKCTITNWQYIYELCGDVAAAVRAGEFEPDIIVALARGGWFAGRCLCDFLGLDDLTSLKIEHYVGTAEKAEEPVVRYPLPDGSVADKNVLVVDDIADTGQSIQRGYSYVTDRAPSTVRTATLQLLGTSEFKPEYVGERLDEWAWIVYPWNFIEDMIDLITGVMTKESAGPYSKSEIRELLAAYHDIERIQMEIAQPNRLDEVLTEMARRDVINDTASGWQLTAQHP